MLQLSQFNAMPLDSAMLVNHFEFGILKTYLTTNNIDQNTFVTNELFGKIGQNGVVCVAFPGATREQIEKKKTCFCFTFLLVESFFCHRCARAVAIDLLYQYRKSIPADKLPPARPG